MELTSHQRTTIIGIATRAAGLRERESSPYFRTAATAPGDIGKRRAAWMSALGSQRDGVLDTSALLAARGLDADAIVRCLSNVELRDAARLPPWAMGLVQLLESEVWRAPGACTRIHDRYGMRPRPELGALGSLVDWAIVALGEQLDPLPLRVGDEAFRRLIRSFEERFMKLLFPTLLIELRVARQTRDDDEALDLHRFYAERLADRDQLLALLDLYPVLARCVQQTASHWLRDAVETLQRLVADRAVLAREFGCSEHALGELDELTTDLGDRHHGGRVVKRLVIAGDIEIMYKPRDLHIAQWYGELCRHVTPDGDLHVRKVVARDGYAWEQRIPSADVRDRAQAADYFRRLGTLLRLLEEIRGSDMHADNLIPHGTHPVAVDLEALFQPRFAAVGSNEAERAAAAMFEDSPLAVSLLPRWHGGEPGVRAVESGGIQRGGVRRSGRRLAAASSDRLSEASIEMRYREERISRTVPAIDGVAVEPIHYRDDLIAGYQAMAQRLRACRGELVRPGGLLDRADGMRVRCLFRHSKTYAAVTYASYKPELLADGRDRELAFELMFHGVDPTDAGSVRVVEAEIRASLAGDIPCFSTGTNGGDVWEGAQRVDDIRIPDMLARVRNELGNRPDDAASVDAIASSFAGGPWRHSGSEARALPTTAVEASDAELLAAAVEIADQVADWAYVSGGAEASWFGMDYTPTRDAWDLDILRPNLIAGSSGIAVFFARAFAAIGDPRYASMSRSALSGSLAATHMFCGDSADSAETWSGPFYCGALVGLGANLAAIGTCARLLDAPDLASTLAHAIDTLPHALIRAHAPHDFVTGTAGLAAVIAAHAPLLPHGAGESLAELWRGVDEAVAGNVQAPIPPDSGFLDSVPSRDVGIALARAYAARSRAAGDSDEIRIEGLTPGNLSALMHLSVPGGRSAQTMAELAVNDWLRVGGVWSDFDALDVGATAASTYRAPVLQSAARVAASRFLARRRSQGRWFPLGVGADRHRLGVIRGLPGLADAFMRIAQRRTWPSYRVGVLPAPRDAALSSSWGATHQQRGETRQ